MIGQRVGQACLGSTSPTRHSCPRGQDQEWDTHAQHDPENDAEVA